MVFHNSLVLFYVVIYLGIITFFVIVAFLFSQLLHDQVGVVVFEPYKPLFMLAFARGKTALPAMPGGPPLFGHPHRNW